MYGKLTFGVFLSGLVTCGVLYLSDSPPLAVTGGGVCLLVFLVTMVVRNR